MKSVDDVCSFKYKTIQELLTAIRKDVCQLGYDLHDKKPFSINNMGVFVQVRKIRQSRNPFAWEILEYTWSEPPPYQIKTVKDKIFKISYLSSVLLWFRFFCIVTGVMFVFTSVLFFILGNLVSFLMCLCVGVLFLILFCVIQHEVI